MTDTGKPQNEEKVIKAALSAEGVGASTNAPLQSERNAKRKTLEKKKSFKAVGNLILAMRRFQASLNPTYTFGKQSTSISSEGDHAASPRVEDDAAYPNPSQKLKKKTYSSYGHKGNYLFKSLTENPAEGEV